MKNHLFFDHASTTRCCEEAVRLIQTYASEDYGNPSSAHIFGQKSNRAIRETRSYFAEIFRVSPDQVIFTGSGSESDNLAIYGVANSHLYEKNKKQARVLCSAIEHPAVKKTVLSLTAQGVDAQLIPVDSNGQIEIEKFLTLITTETILVSIQQVNNIMGAIQDVEKLAKIAKEKAPDVIFHTDAIQAFGRIDTPTSASSVDLVSISAHKIEGPKGVGALIVLNPKLLKSGLRPLIWGGEQEGGFRSGTQNAGLIAGFRAAAEMTLKKKDRYRAHTFELRQRLHSELKRKKLINDSNSGTVRWNSVENKNVKTVPHIISLSFPGFPVGSLAMLLEERGCLVSTGSACSSKKMEPDAVLCAMGFPVPIQSSMIRVSLSDSLQVADIDHLANALEESIGLMRKLLGNHPHGKPSSTSPLS